MKDLAEQNKQAIDEVKTSMQTTTEQTQQSLRDSFREFQHEANKNIADILAHVNLQTKSTDSKLASILEKLEDKSSPARKAPRSSGE